MPEKPKRPIELTVDSEIVLRQFRAEDAKVIFELIGRNRKHLSQHNDNTSLKYPTEASVLESIEHPKNPSRLRFGIWVKETYVGTINITPQDDKSSAEIGDYIGKEFTNKGYSTKSLNRIVLYAFENLRLSEVFGLVHKDNTPSIKVLCKAGFTEASEKRKGDILFYNKHKLYD